MLSSKKKSVLIKIIRKNFYVFRNMSNHYFFNILNSFKNICGSKFPSLLIAESKMNTAKQVRLQLTLGISLS